MAGKDDPTNQPTDTEFIARTCAAFVRDVFTPTLSRAASAPEEARAVMSEIRRKLDALEVAIEPVGISSGADPMHDEKAAQPAGVSADQAATPERNGDAPQPATQNGADKAGEAYDDIGRNQRSKLRELTLLDFISRETRPYSLHQVMTELGGKGFDDNNSAVVSHLHRLKRLEVVDQPAPGMYQITTHGLSHLHKLRGDFGPLMPDPHQKPN